MRNVSIHASFSDTAPASAVMAQVSRLAWPQMPYISVNIIVVQCAQKCTFHGEIFVQMSQGGVHDTIHIRPDFLAKYGIDRKASSEECSAKAEKAYRELDARFVKMTGRRPYADELFNGMKKKQSDSSEERPSRKQHIRQQRENVPADIPRAQYSQQ